MIDARELRIGSIVSTYGTNGNPKGWSEISCKAHHIQTCIERNDIFRGIPLSEERLLKFGFNIQKPSPFYKMVARKGGFNIYSDKDGTLHYGLIDRAVIIQYVHQLQNLYFALTGEELTIKEGERV